MLFPFFLLYDSLAGVAVAAAAVVHVAHRVTGHKYTLVVADTQTRLTRRTTYLGLGTR